jgi:hypothetical protein
MSTPTTDDEQQGRLARRVTLGTVAVLLVIPATTIDAWPLTSFRLFSTLRTGATSGYALMAVDANGTTTRVELPHDEVVGGTVHQYGELAHESAATQRAKVRAWLAAGGIDPADVASVELVRTARRTDAAGVAHVTSTSVVLRVTP